MTHSSLSPTRKRPSALISLLIGLVSLFAVGCGDSQQDYVFTGTGQQPASTGNVVFQFEKAQNQTVVPDATTGFDFVFYDVQGGDVVYTAESAYADQVTVEDVPTNATFVVVTARGTGDIPLVTYTGTFNLPAGNTINVTLSAGTTVTFTGITVSPSTVNLVAGTQGDSQQLSIVGSFSNGESITFNSSTFPASASFTGNDPAVATVTSGGLVEGVANGETSVTVTYNIGGVPQTDVVDINVTGGVVQEDTLTVTPSTLQLPANTTSSDLVAIFTPAGGSPVPVTGSEFLSFALDEPVTGISVNNETGAVTVAAGTEDNVTATVIATYNDGEGNSATDTVVVTVGDLEVLFLTGIPNNTFTFPTGTLFSPIIGVQLSDGTQDFYVAGDTYTGRDYDLTFTSGSPAVVNTTSDGFLSYALTNTTGNATITVTADDASTALTARNIATSSYELNIVPTEIDVDVNGTAGYQIVADYGAETQDLTFYMFFDYTSSDGGQILGFNPQTATTAELLEFLADPYIIGVQAGTAEMFPDEPIFFLSLPGTPTINSADVTITGSNV